ncbi:MAG TPA: GldG family protein [Candidatus Paceibacterota bacterium]|nr:GldG family protein [Candidatus Paceibacterota bacterium]
MAITSNQPSFSRRRKWSIGFNVALMTVAVFAFVVMVNYLGNRYFRRFYLSSNTRIELSPHTTSLLRSVTNNIQVTLYFDRDEALFSDVSELLKEYHSTNPKIQVATVDYLRDPGAAEDLRIKYSLGSSTNKNWVIFDCAGRVQKVEGSMLGTYQLEQIKGEDPQRPEFRRKTVAFNGEMLFTAAVLGVINPKPLHASFLQGHGEHDPADKSEMGFAKFVSILQQNYVDVTPLELLGTNNVPDDCNLLVIAGPRDPFQQIELDRIERYVNEGGRLFVMFNVASTNQQTGLEKILAKFGVEVGSATVVDPVNTTVGTDVIVGKFSTKHPSVNPLTGSRIQMILPRPVSKFDLSGQAKDESIIEELAFAGPASYLRNGGSNQTPKAWPLMVAVEKAPTKVVLDRGTTRILVTGDSIFLGNRQIQSGANRDFANYAVSWLLERNVFAQGVGPKSVTEFRLLVPQNQMRTLQWLLLGAIPGGVLLLGGVIWLTRRK